MRQYIGGGTWPASLIMSVNHGTAGASTNGIEFSDWAVAGAVIYSCNLNSTQIKQVWLCTFVLVFGGACRLSSMLGCEAVVCDS